MRRRPTPGAASGAGCGGKPGRALSPRGLGRPGGGTWLAPSSHNGPLRSTAPVAALRFAWWCRAAQHPLCPKGPWACSPARCARRSPIPEGVAVAAAPPPQCTSGQALRAELGVAPRPAPAVCCARASALRALRPGLAAVLPSAPAGRGLPNTNTNSRTRTAKQPVQRSEGRTATTERASRHWPPRLAPCSPRQGQALTGARAARP